MIKRIKYATQRGGRISLYQQPKIVFGRGVSSDESPTRAMPLTLWRPVWPQTPVFIILIIFLFFIFLLRLALLMFGVSDIMLQIRSTVFLIHVFSKKRTQMVGLKWLFMNVGIHGLQNTHSRDRICFLGHFETPSLKVGFS